MRLRQWSNSRWSRLFLWLNLSYLLFIMLLLLSVNEVKAQTDTPTPGFATVSPGSTPTPAGGVESSEVTFDFRSGAAGFSSLFGSHVIALGWQTNNEIMDLKGGYGMVDVSQIIMSYNSNASFEVGLELCESDCLGDDPIVYFQYGLMLPACPSGCDYTYSVPSETIGRIKLSFQAESVGEPYDDVFVVSVLRVVFVAGVFDYELDGDCPILTEEQIDKLDPIYFSDCRRCFLEPTPVRANQINTTSIPTATLNTTLESTFVIPIMVSGTPMTATPNFGGGAPTIPPATPTLGATALPDGLFIDFNNLGGFISNVNGGSPGGTGNPSPGHGSSTFTGSNDASYRSASVSVDVRSLSSVASIEFDYYMDRTDRGDGALGVQVYLLDSYGQVTIDADGTIVGETPLTGSGIGGFTGAHLTWRNFSYTFAGASGVQSVVIATWMGSGADGHDTSWFPTLQIDNVRVYGVPASSTATPTFTPLPTGVAWIPTPDLSDVNCSVISLRDDRPIAEFPTNFTIVDYGCYTIVPEVEITLAEPDIIINGLSICVTWFQLPVIAFLGIAATLDWLLIALSVYLIAIIMRI